MSASPDDLKRATDALIRGGIVCLPTETMYGLAVDIASPSALAALVQLKGRDSRAPFGLIISDVAQAEKLATSWPRLADDLARRYWPGPLTLVVPARPDLPAQLVGPGGGVGVRVSSHPIALGVARALGRPITATSANPSGQPPARSVAQATGYFGDAVTYLDGGPSSDEPPSTVVAIDGDGRASVLRHGPIDVSGDIE